MLTENDVICAVTWHLRDKGWRIEKVSTTGQRGFDILARKGQTSLVVEAKGGTSSKPGTSRYDKGFDRTQKGKHVSVALYWAARVRSDGQHDKVGIALPADKDHRELIDKISPALKTLSVVVYLVHPDRRVVEIR